MSGHSGGNDDNRLICGAAGQKSSGRGSGDGDDVDDVDDADGCDGGDDADGATGCGPSRHDDAAAAAVAATSTASGASCGGGDWGGVSVRRPDARCSIVGSEAVAADAVLMLAIAAIYIIIL